MEISKLQLNKKASTVKSEIERFIAEFQRCKNAPPLEGSAAG